MINLKKYLKDFFSLSTVQIITVFFGFLKYKLITIYFGTFGISLIGIYQNILDILKNGFGLGISQSLITFVSSSSGENKNKFTKVSIQISIISGVFGLIFLFISSGLISDFFENEISTFSIKILGIIFLINNVCQVIMSLFQAYNKVKYFNIITLINIIASILIFYLVFEYAKFNQIIWSLIISSIFSLITCVFIFKRNINYKSIPISLKELINRSKKIVNVGGILMISSVITSVLLLLLRNKIIFVSGNEISGIFQSVWTISTITSSIFLIPIQGYFYPKVFENLRNKVFINNLLNNQLYIILILTFIGCSFLIIFSDFTLTLLFSSDFIQGNLFLKISSLSVFVSIFSWPFGIFFLNDKNIKLSLYSDLIFYFIFYSSIIFITNYNTLFNIGVFYFFGHLLRLFYIIFMFNKTFDFRTESRVYYLFGLSLISLFLLFVINSVIFKILIILVVITTLLNVILNYAKRNN